MTPQLPSERIARLGLIIILTAVASMPFSIILSMILTKADFFVALIAGMISTGLGCFVGFGIVCFSILFSDIFDQ